MSQYIPSELQVMTDHVQSMHGFKCTECDDCFKNKDQLKEHLEKEHTESDYISDEE